MFLVVGQDTFDLGQDGALHGLHLTTEFAQFLLLVPKDHQEFLHHICSLLEDRLDRFLFNVSITSNLSQSTNTPACLCLNK